jgi:hypothetical protein
MNSRRFIANLAPDASQPDRKQFFGKGPSVRMSGPGHSRRLGHIRLSGISRNAGLPLSGIACAMISEDFAPF